ncbi:MAG: radical SAM family heme chaperone HemW [Proteobacteria bacterium]|nr:radical SAM family heme chaperone HemW [Pseudomonadota bacterium]
MIAPHNLYLHVPYCSSKCNYCAFYSVACNPDWAAFAAAAIRDIKYWGAQLKHCAAPTVFFGGGTPSLMPTEIFAQIMDAVRESFAVAANAEITLESNPGTLDPPSLRYGAASATRLREFIAHGVNRLSVGVQSLDDTVLKFLGRGHNARAARDLIGAAHDAGIRVSGDFIYALPGQTVQDAEKMCRDILELGLRHVSLYELSIEPGTPFAAQNLQTQIPDNGTVAEMYQVIGEILAPSLSRYEISNYAAPGHECRHNANIWAGQPYVGIGPSACGRVLIDGVWYEQAEPKNTKEWLERTPVGANNYLPLQSNTRATEIIMTGLRTMRGVVITPEIREVINWDFVQKNPDYFIPTNDSLCMTQNGILILDNLLVDLIW